MILRYRGRYMLFDPRPKECSHELYGRQKELRRLLTAFKRGEPLILLLGIRRVGKTSLLKVALRESGLPYIYLDLRAVGEDGFTRAALYIQLSGALSRLSTRYRIADYLRRVRGVKILGSGVELDWGMKPPLLNQLFTALNNWAIEQQTRIIIALDEAQLLRYMTGGKGRLNFRALLAHVYDNLRQLTTVLTGSEIGLLMEFLEAGGKESEFYGRYREEVILERFNREEAIGYLRAGFRELGIEPEDNSIIDAVEKLDGVVGWLALYGYTATRNPDKEPKEILQQVITEAKSVATQELRKLIYASHNYRLVLKAVAEGVDEWSKIKRRIESWSGKYMSNAALTRLLTRLQNLSIVGKSNGRYFFLDPIMRLAALEL
ncbi:MAG: ATP-binding protein [Aigarchaeota archaeon]|nr:ATP-binding protein [Candidatus Pelearchaeum maunauluense]